MSYVTPMNAARWEIHRSRPPFAGLGAVSVSTMDSQAKAAFNSLPGWAAFVNALPVPSSMKYKLKNKPVSAFISPINAQKRKWVEVVNLTTSLGKLGSSVKANGVTVSTKAEYSDPAATVLKKFMAVAGMRPISALQAILIKEAKMSLAAAKGAAGLLQMALGMGGSLGASEDDSDWTAKDVKEVVGASGAIIAAAAAIAKVAGPLLVPIIEGITGKAVPGAGARGRTGGSTSPGGKKKKKKHAPPSAEGGMPSWVLPAGVGLAAVFFLRRR